MTPDEIKMLKPLERIAAALETQTKQLTLLSETWLARDVEPFRMVMLHERDLLAALAVQIWQHVPSDSLNDAVENARALLEVVDEVRQESVEEVPA